MLANHGSGADLHIWGLEAPYSNGALPACRPNCMDFYLLYRVWRSKNPVSAAAVMHTFIDFHQGPTRTIWQGPRRPLQKWLLLKSAPEHVYKFKGLCSRPLWLQLWDCVPLMAQCTLKIRSTVFLHGVCMLRECNGECTHEQHVRRTLTLSLTITAYSVGLSGDVVQMRILICTTRRKPCRKEFI